jgi:acyl-CoA thioester hydrolase
VSQLLSPWGGEVLEQWVDYNGHLRDAFYLLIFSFATDGVMDQIGLDAAGRALTGHTLYTLETHLNYLMEVKQGVAVQVRTQILGADARRLHLYHTLHRQDSQEALAANEQMLINVDSQSARAAPFAPKVAALVRGLADLHRDLPRPRYAGRSIALPALVPAT